MNKSDFLALKELFEQYQACQQALEKLNGARRTLDSERMTSAGMFSVQIGAFRTQVGMSAEARTEAFRKLVFDIIDQLTTYYQEQLVALDQQIAER